MPSSSSSCVPTGESTSTVTAPPLRPPRCPLALQEIFLASNSGNEVHTPPPANMASKTFQRADWNFHAQQQQQQRGNTTRSLLLNPFSRATTTTAANTALPSKSLLGVSKGRVESLSQRIPLQTQQHDALFAAALPNYSDEAKKCMSPQEFLNALLQEDPQRAKYYSTESYNVKDSAYYNQPTAFQLKSYGSHLTNMVRRSNADALRDMLVSTNEGQEQKMGLSPNACNVYGESIITMICRRGDLKLLQVLMDTGCCSLQVSDDCGRTPLHDSCWSCAADQNNQPCFAVIETILQADPRLLYMKDARGALPLDYVPKQHWDAWKRFLVRVVLDAYFPIIIDDANDEHDNIQKQGPPELTRYPPNSHPVSTPPNSLPNALAAMVAFGKLTPDEARMMASPDDDTDDDDGATVDSSSNYDEDDVDDDSSSSSSRSSSSDSEDYDSEEDFSSYSGEDDDDDESYEFAMNNPDEDMDQVLIMTGSLLTGKLL